MIANWLYHLIVIYILGIGVILLRHCLLSLISDLSQEENVDNYQHTGEETQERRFRKGCMVLYPQQKED